MSVPEDGNLANRVPAWRVGTGLVVLAALSWVGVRLVPVYLRNWELEKCLRETLPASDEILKQTILNQGRSRGLDILPDHLQIRHSPTDGRTDLRYVVRVRMPLYTVDLHFSSSISAAGQ